MHSAILNFWTWKNPFDSECLAFVLAHRKASGTRLNRVILPDSPQLLAPGLTKSWSQSPKVSTLPTINIMIIYNKGPLQTIDRFADDPTGFHFQAFIFCRSSPISNHVHCKGGGAKFLPSSQRLCAYDMSISVQNSGEGSGLYIQLQQRNNQY